VKVIDAFLEKANAPKTIKKSEILLVVCNLLGENRSRPSACLGAAGLDGRTSINK
jgi:hypothetical protein